MTRLQSLRQWNALVARLERHDAAELEAMQQRAKDVERSALFVAADASTMALQLDVLIGQREVVAGQAPNDTRRMATVVKRA
jgi:chemotaxis protein histidine kinase CheA